MAKTEEEEPANGPATEAANLMKLRCERNEQLGAGEIYKQFKGKLHVSTGLNFLFFILNIVTF